MKASIYICLKIENNKSIFQQNGPFEWSKEIQGHILGAFFYGYLVSQIPAGMLSERYTRASIIAIPQILWTVDSYYFLHETRQVHLLLRI